MKRNKHLITLFLLIFGILSSQDSSTQRPVTDLFEEHLIFQWPYPQVNTINNIFTIDINNDGELDIISGGWGGENIYWYENDGNENFTQYLVDSDTDCNTSVFAIDIDQDGDVDIFSASVWDHTIAWHRNDGNENFTRINLTTNAYNAREVSAADIDEDGDIDVFATAPGDNEIIWFNNDGNENFSEITISSTCGGCMSLELIDINGDGNMDILSGEYSDPSGDGSQIIWYENNSSGSFIEHKIEETIYNTVKVIAVDIDQDGDKDIISTDHNGSNRVWWYLNDGNENFTAHYNFQGTGTVWGMATADLEGDGDIDLLTGAGDLIWSINDGDGNFTNVSIGVIGSMAFDILIEDLNKDGNLDIITQNYPQNKILYYENLMPPCCDDTDGDGVIDDEDYAPYNPYACSDNDGDTCDDCSSGIFDTANDGDDYDADGLCDSGDSEPECPTNNTDECGVCDGPGVLDGFTYFEQLPETAAILDGNFCLSDVDLDALSDLIEANNLTAYDDSTALEVGNQTWNGGRLKVLQASYSPSGTDGVNTQLTTLPASFGNLSELASLYLEWNNLTSLPESFSQLTSLSSLTINNNWLTGLPSDIGNIQNLLFLDLGYNQLSAIPASVCTMESLIYLYLFNNELTALPDCMCNLSIDWSGQDGGWSPYFASGGNYLCENVPDCIESSSYFENTLDQFYYSAILDAPQGCCMEEAACNFNENATVNNDCEHPGDEGTDYENECDCDGNVADCAGDCDGSLIGTGVFECIDQSYSNQVDCVNSGSLWEQIGNDCNGNCGGSAVEDCAGQCGGYAVIDDCGVCGGNNSTCDVIISFGVVDGNAGTAEIYVVNNEPIAGFQFDIIFNGIPVDISGASGGSAESAGFLISSSSTTVLGFSLTGASIPAGEGVLIVVEFNYDAEVVGEVELCLTNVVLSNTSGHSLSVSVGDCAIMAPSECDLGDVNGDYIYNVIDIVILANCILSDNCDEELPFPCSADINGDGMYNVIDIVLLANCVLGISDNCG